MTKDYNQIITCENCGHENTTEIAYLKWFRHEPQLDSVQASLVRYDLDMILHRYRLNGSRDIQYMMFIEVKSHGADLDEAQQDTLSMLSQVLRHDSGIYVLSRRNKRPILLKCYGGHLLQLSGSTPDNSESLIWDRKFEICKSQLISLLRFELDPDTLEPITVPVKELCDK